MKKVLVTGGNGFIGSSLVTQLRKRDDLEVIAITRDDVNLAWRDAHAIENRFSAFLPADYVIHCASTTHNYHMLDNPTLDAQVNIIGLTAILGAIKKYSHKTRFVNIGTFFSEEIRGLYGATKKCAEEIVSVYNKVHGLNTCTVRLPNVYGPGETGSKQKGALNWMIQQMVAGETVEVYGLNYRRQFLYIDDAVAHILAELTKLTRFIPVRAEARSVREFVQRINDYTDGKFEEVPMPEFHAQVGPRDHITGSAHVDKDNIPIEEGVLRTVNYYKI